MQADGCRMKWKTWNHEPITTFLTRFAPILTQSLESRREQNTRWNERKSERFQICSDPRSSELGKKGLWQRNTQSHLDTEQDNQQWAPNSSHICSLRSTLLLITHHIVYGLTQFLHCCWLTGCLLLQAHILVLQAEVDKWRKVWLWLVIAI